MRRIMYGEPKVQNARTKIKTHFRKHDDETEYQQHFWKRDISYVFVFELTEPKHLMTGWCHFLFLYYFCLHEFQVWKDGRREWTLTGTKQRTFRIRTRQILSNIVSTSASVITSTHTPASACGLSSVHLCWKHFKKYNIWLSFDFDFGSGLSKPKMPLPLSEEWNVILFKSVLHLWAAVIAGADCRWTFSCTDGQNRVSKQQTSVAPPFLIYRHFVRRETKIICQIFSSTRLVVAVRMHWLWNCRPISALTLILYFIFVPEETKRKFFIKNKPVLALHGTIFEHLASPESVMPSYPLILGSFIGASLPHALSMYYNLSVERPQLVRFLSSFCTFEELKLSEADKERPCHWMVNVLLIG